MHYSYVSECTRVHASVHVYVCLCICAYMLHAYWAVPAHSTISSLHQKYIETYEFHMDN